MKKVTSSHHPYAIPLSIPVDICCEAQAFLESLEGMSTKELNDLNLIINLELKARIAEKSM